VPPAKIRNFRRNSSDSEVSNSIMPSTLEITPAAVLPDRSNSEMASRVSAVAGTLPTASSPTIRHCTV
jgi:hypothetical protein